MKTKKLLSVALVSALLAACSSSGGGGNGVRLGTSSLSSVPQQYRDTVSKAKTMSLVEPIGTGSSLSLNGKTGEYNFSELPNGHTDLSMSMSYQTVQGNAATATGTMLVYQQPYSVVTGEIWTQDTGDHSKNYTLDAFYFGEILGFTTPAAAVTTLTNQNAIFEYKGLAFDGKEQGTLNYTMNFGAKKGSGSITGFTRTGLIDLLPSNLFVNGAKINGTQVDILIGGSVQLEKAPQENNLKYNLSFFGPNAEELAGSLYDVKNDGVLGDDEIIFAGKR